MGGRLLERGWLPVALAWLLAAPASAQSIGERGCQIPKPTCPYEIGALPDPGFQEGIGLVAFKAEYPGRYEFEFSAQNRCLNKSAIANVYLRCPSAPIATAAAAKSVIFLGEKNSLTATGSKATYPNGRVVSYTWYLLRSPNPSDKATIDNRVPVSTSEVFQTSAYSAAGAYQYKVVVYDGCSSSEFPVCFTVECNCKPTANAGATSTIWQNTDKVFNNGLTSAGSNSVSCQTQPSFTLDGSLSYDFDEADVLSYEWTFTKWVALFPSRTWTPQTDIRPTYLTEGYKTTCQVQQAGGDFTTLCSFRRMGKLGQQSFDRTETNIIQEAPKILPPSSAVGYPKSVPVYTSEDEKNLNAEQNLGKSVYSKQGTWYQANISKTVESRIEVTREEYNQTTCIGPAEADETYCEIQITQRQGVGATARNNPIAELKLGCSTTDTNSLRACRGLWSFRLTVKDQCGDASASSDDITVTARCNEPPVAVACCNVTSVWKGTSFDQVRLDGRSSNSGDHVLPSRQPQDESLSYYWSFVKYPMQTTIDLTGCPTMNAPCVEGYCNKGANPAYSTNIGTNEMIFSTALPPGRCPNRNGAPRPGDDRCCGPTVFPVIYDSQNGGAVVIPTQSHVGNSAYFRPIRRGEYVVELEVSDGCSSTKDYVTVNTVCPEMTISMSLSKLSETKSGSGTVSVDCTATVQYAEPNPVITYVWSAIDEAGNAAGSWTDSSKDKGTVTFSARGRYTITITAMDGSGSSYCQQVKASQSFTVSCNTSPGSATAQIISPTSLANGGTLYWQGTSFPEVAIQASAADADGDGLTYEFTHQIAGANAAGDQMRFRPTRLLGAFDFDVDSGLGRYARMADTYSVSMTASDGCSSSGVASANFRVACLGQLRASVGTSQVARYEYATNQFPVVKIDGSSSTFGGTPGAEKNYQWAGSYFPTNSNVGTRLSDSSTDSSGWTSPVLSFRPDKVGLYMMSLTINDGCTFSSAKVQVDASCDVSAISRILVSGQPVTNTPFQYEWNSYLSATQGGFPSVSLDGSTSTGAANSALKYEWSYAQGTAASGLQKTLEAQSTYTPPAAGIHTLTLRVRNGVCPDASTTVRIQATCLRLVAYVRQQSDQGVSQGISYTVYFDGTKFPRADIDGTATEYVNDAGKPGNYERLRYTWEMTMSPLNSFYEAYRLVFQDTSRASTPTPFVKGPTAVNSTCNLREISVVREVPTTTFKTRVTLANKHYNRPTTCFVPDKPGTYEVKLTIEDGCTTSTATARITALCLGAPVVSFSSTMPTELSLNTSAVNRVNLLGEVTADPKSISSLTYNWAIVSSPADSVHQPDRTCTITNSFAPRASILIDVAGEYKFSLTADDGCNDPVTSTITLRVSCTDDITLQRLTATPSSINFTAVGTMAPPFQSKTISLSSGAASYCSGLKYRWRLVNRVCTEPWEAQAAPPPPSTCAPGCHKCSWAVTKTPCATPAVNPDYAAPILKHDPLSCKGTFKPRYPGTYALQFTIQDCCGQDTDTMLVVARCQNRVYANPLRYAYSSLYSCNSTRMSFQYSRVTVEASAEIRAVSDGNVDAVESCPVPPTPPTTCASYSADTVKECCPQEKCCGAANQYMCPQCPGCPNCPTCYALSETAGGSASLRSRKTLVSRSAFLSTSEHSSRREDAPFYTYSVVPLCAVVLLSLVVNGYWVNDILNSKRRLAAHPKITSFV